MLHSHALRLSCLATVFVATAASADPAYNWSGFYLGGGGGYASGRLVTTESSLTTSGSLFGISPTTSATYPGADNDTPFNGGFGGAIVGINSQNGAGVLGVETDIQFANIFRSDTIPGGPDPRVDTSAELQWFGTLRARAGLAVDRALFYGTGGLAYGHARGAITVTANGGLGNAYSSDDSGMQVGYVVGGGMEAALTDHWIVRAEYLYMDLGTQKYDFTFATSADGSTATSKEKITESLLRAAVAYKF
jgi:outer membrane immunogenic protein